jgi:hypothetical protein
LSVDDGASIVKYAQFYPSPEFDSEVLVRMFSIDKATFDFYKSLLYQFNNDGGAFSPTPAAQRGNTSNGGIGLFRALDESTATVFFKSCTCVVYQGFELLPNASTVYGHSDPPCRSIMDYAWSTTLLFHRF